nr:hypothetical protein [Tanacetum cinerariifolium]
MHSLQLPTRPYPLIQMDYHGGIPLMNAIEFPEINPYEEVSQQGQVHLLSPTYVLDPMELDEHVPIYVLKPEHSEYHAPSDDDIHVEDDDEDLEGDPSAEHEPEDDDEDPEEDPNEEHELEDEYTKEPSEASDETEPPQTPMVASTKALINSFSTGSSPFPLPPTSPTYDQAPLGYRAAMIRMRDDILEEDMPPGGDLYLLLPHLEDVSYVRALQASEQRMMTSIEEFNLRTDRRDIRLEIDVVRGQRTAYETELQERQSAKDLAVTLMMRIHALEARAWTDTMEDASSSSYTQRFQELALMCTKFLADETEKVDKYISGLLDNIHRNVMSARPKTLGETIELANDLMDQTLRTYAERQNENKRKTDDSSKNNQQQPHKKQNVARAYIAVPGEKKDYTGDLPLCTKCNYHHTRQCAPKCRKCKRHIKKNCPKLKNHRNGSGNGIAQGRAYVLGGRDASLDSNVIMGTFLLNNHYAKILFDTGADRSFVSTTFSALIDITPTTLENHYGVELADGKIIGVNTIIRGCTLNFMNHPFNIDLLPVPLGSFNVIIGMDWLTKYHGVIICDEKIVRVPFGREMLIFQGNGDHQIEKSRLNIISYTKAQEYLSKGCDVFLAHITTKEAKDKSKGKRLEDVSIVRDFPEDLPGISPTRQVEFQIDLVPGAAPVAQAPYWLAPSEMKELANNFKNYPTKDL